jgi:hypothetical protein
MVFWDVTEYSWVRIHGTTSTHITEDRNLNGIMGYQTHDNINRMKELQTGENE